MFMWYMLLCSKIPGAVSLQMRMEEKISEHRAYDSMLATTARIVSHVRGFLLKCVSGRTMQALIRSFAHVAAKHALRKRVVVGGLRAGLFLRMKAKAETLTVVPIAGLASASFLLLGIH